MLALGGESEHLEQVAPLLPHLTYLGKRGSFFQLLAPPHEVETVGSEPPAGFIALVSWNDRESFPLGYIQRLDDWGAALTFDMVNIYTTERIIRGCGRISMDVVLPYRLIKAGRGFAIYEVPENYESR